MAAVRNPEPALLLLGRLTSFEFLGFRLSAGLLVFFVILLCYVFKLNVYQALFTILLNLYAWDAESLMIQLIQQKRGLVRLY